MSSAPCADGPTNPDDCELRAHIFEDPLILREKHVFSFLNSLKPRLVDLVQNRLALPTWMPHEDVRSQLDERTEDFLKKLELPCVLGRPSLLLHNLGHFVEQPELQERVNNVFLPDTPQNTIFINTSGSGKTRLLLEGLCQHWGLYFTSHADSTILGSHDLQNAIQSTIPTDDKSCRPLPPSTSSLSNDEIAGRVFKRVFLARVLIFRLFVEAMKANSCSDSGSSKADFRDYRRKWLFLQLQPTFFLEIFDPFDELTHKLSAATYSDAQLDELTRDALHCIRNTLTSCIKSTSSPPLYWIIDEAQFAARELTDAFRPEDMQRRPILRPLIRTFSTLPTSGLNIILAGTGLSLSDVDDTMSSGTMKLSRRRVCDDTGAFEGWEGRNGMSSWVKTFVPDWILEESDRTRLEERLGCWLKGRYRFAAGYVTELLRHGYRQPNLLLNAYIHEFTGFTPTDDHEAVQKERLGAGIRDVKLEPRDKPEFSKLKSDPRRMIKIRDNLPLYVMRSIFFGSLGDDEHLWVEYGFGRLRRDKDKRGSVVVFDEPLIVAAANYWFSKELNLNYEYFASRIGDHNPWTNGLENYMVYCIDLIFGTKKRKLKQVFKFHGVVPSWANKRAKLVSVYISPMGSHSAAPSIDDVKHARFSGPSAELGTYTRTPDETLQWLAHGSRTAFCFPCRNMGPDVIFVLELDNKKLIWVALQVKYSESNGNKLIEKSKLEDAISTVTPERFFRDKNGSDFSADRNRSFNQETRERLRKLPNRCEDAGECSLLRVVASFPARSDFTKKAQGLWKGDEHPIASLNMEFVKKVTKDLAPLNILQNRERDWNESYGRAPKRIRDSDIVDRGKRVEKRRKTTENEDSDACESSSGKSVDSQKRERDADDSESGSGREKKRKTVGKEEDPDVSESCRDADDSESGDSREKKIKTLDVQDTKKKLSGAARRSEAKRSEKPIIPSAAMPVGKTKRRRWTFRK